MRLTNTGVYLRAESVVDVFRRLPRQAVVHGIARIAEGAA
jgi:hypothetical protein